MMKEKDKEVLRKFGKGMGKKGGGSGQQGKGIVSNEENQIIEAISKEPLTPFNLVKWSEKLGEILVQRRLKSAKLRRIYDPVTVLKSKLRATIGKSEQERNKNLESIRASLLFLKPKLRSEAYRERGVEPLARALETYIDRVIESKEIEDYDNFINFFESIVGYHKGFGGRD